MAYELWTSPVTGYRRRGTRASEFRSLFETGLTVTSIYEPLRCCNLGDPESDIRRELERLDFDIVGVRDPQSTRVVGWICREAIEGDISRDLVQSIEPHHVVSDSTPLRQLIRVLGFQPWVLVVVGHGIRGIVTRADLQKPPVRTLVFGQLSLLEMHLTYWVGVAYPAEAWCSSLNPTRIKKAKALWKERKDRNEEISLVDCLQLCDKRDLVTASKDLRDILNLGSKKAATRFLKKVERLRDRVAHSQKDIVTGSDWEGLAETMRALGNLLEASDREVERRVKGAQSPQLVAAF